MMRLMILAALALTFGSSSNVSSLPDIAVLVRAEGTPWLNTVPLSAAKLQKRVVLVDFWTYSCINSLRNLRYVQTWAAKYKNDGLIVIGVHSPEFSFEKNDSNVRNAVRALGITYPVAIDSRLLIWNAFNNEYWPADYIIDGDGRIRYHNFGEGEYVRTERAIQTLLRENGAQNVSGVTTFVGGTGVEQAPSSQDASPETYVGYARAQNFISPQHLGASSIYALPERFATNEWALSGSWQVGPEYGLLRSAGGKIAFRFHARDLNMVLGTRTKGHPVRFTVTIDGHALGNDRGVDTAPDGRGVVTAPRLYQLVRQAGIIHDRTFQIEFDDPGVEAYSFTFG
jgi:thiol-disulfide isomerase/thioredoxin